MSMGARGCMTLGMFTLACASSQPAPPGPGPVPPALCSLERPSGAPRPDAATWFALILRGYDPATGRVTSPPLDCTGAQVRWDGPALRCEDGRAATTALPDRPLGPADVVATSVSADSTLVWIPTTRYASGDAAGPVALVIAVGRELRVVALGPLRAYRDQARLRLEPLGATKVLVAEGDSCAMGGHDKCVRASRVVPLRGDRFTPTPLVGEDGRCLSPAWFDVARRARLRTRRGWERVELSGSMSFSGVRLTVEEQAVVHDLGRGDERVAERVIERAQSAREVRWERDRLVGTGTPLWWRVGAGEAR